MVRRSIVFVHSIFALVAATAFTGCAAEVDSFASEDVMDESFDDDSPADSLGNVPLRNRATWTQKLTACATQYGAAQRSSGPITSTTGYMRCLQNANDRVFARIARNRDDNVFANNELGTPSEVVYEYRRFATNFCEALNNPNAPIHEGHVADVRLDQARCKLDTEIAIATRIGEYVAFEDTNAPFNSASYLPTFSVPAGDVSECEIADDDVWTELRRNENEIRCIVTATNDTVWNVIAQVIHPPETADPVLDWTFSPATYNGLTRYTNAAVSLCQLVAEAGDVANPADVNAREIPCLKSEVTRISGYIDQFQAIEPTIIALFGT